MPNEAPLESCEGCGRVEAARSGKNPHLIHEFPGSFLFLGDHQFFEGYCVLVLKAHLRELHELSEADYLGLMSEVRASSAALVTAFRPWKMNHSCLGNAMPHIHWHLMPRYESDPNHLHNPWFDMDSFKDHVPSPQIREERIAKIRRELKL
jgi:diadenosine tetraphosphate (Ap4A) HIT family hydrolase